MKCKGVDFHVNDFIYLHTPGQVAGLLGIAQIIEFIHHDDQCLEASVLHYGRYDTVAVSDNDGWPIHLDNVSVQSPASACTNNFTEEALQDWCSHPG